MIQQYPLESKARIFESFAKDRKRLVMEVKKEEYEEVLEETITLLMDLFKHHPGKLKFLEAAVSNKIVLVNVIRTMKNAYLDLFEHFYKGKKYLLFQNSWFFHVNLFFDETIKVEGISSTRATELNRAWSAVVKCAECESCQISFEDQRIILATILSVLSEQLSSKVKEKKNPRVPHCYCSRSSHSPNEV